MATLGMLQVETTADFMSHLRASAQALESVRSVAELPDFTSHLRASSQALESIRSITELPDFTRHLRSASQAPESIRSLRAICPEFDAIARPRADAVRLASEIVRMPYVDMHAFHELLTLKPVDVQAPLQATPSAAPTAEQGELVAEGAQCAIELLALMIEDELPEWLGSNRTALAWGLALAAHRFGVGFKRVTGQVPELYLPNSEGSGYLFTLFPRH